MKGDSNISFYRKELRTFCQNLIFLIENKEFSYKKYLKDILKTDILAKSLLNNFQFNLEDIYTFKSKYLDI